MAVLNRFRFGLRMQARAPRGMTLFAIALTASSLPPVGALGAEPGSLENAIKAAFILKFIPFVSWPSSAPNTETFNVCTEGDDKVAELLPETAQGQSADGRRIAVKAIIAGAPVDDCRIVYVASDMAAGPILQQISAKPILTITQTSSGEHGIIELATLGNHVTFNIDVKLAAGDGITVSSKLLSLAHSVTGAP
jgi:hypothetical protein